MEWQCTWADHPRSLHRSTPNPFCLLTFLVTRGMVAPSVPVSSNNKTWDGQSALSGRILHELHIHTPTNNDHRQEAGIRNNAALRFRWLEGPALCLALPPLARSASLSLSHSWSTSSNVPAPMTTAVKMPSRAYFFATEKRMSSTTFQTRS